MPASGQHWAPEFRSLVEEQFKASGLTATEFARLNGYRPNTIQNLARQVQAQTSKAIEFPEFIDGDEDSDPEEGAEYLKWKRSR